MRRGRLIRLLWPLAIWIAVFGWRTVACKRKPDESGKARRPTVHYNYPPPLPTVTFRPGFTPVIPPE